MKRSTGWFLGSAGTRALILAAILTASAALTVTAATSSLKPPAPPVTPDPLCPVGYNFTNGNCIPTSPQPISCPTGFHMEDGICAPNDVPDCPEGQVYSEDKCIPVTPENPPNPNPTPDPDPTPKPDPVPDPKPDPVPTPSTIPFSELRGVNFVDRLLDRNEGGKRTAVQTAYVDKFVAIAKDSGINVLRIPVRWEGYVDNKDNFLEELEYLVKTANENDIYVWVVFFQYDASSHWRYKVSPYGGGFPEFVVSCYHPTKDYEIDPEIREFWNDYYDNKVRDSDNSCKRTLDVWDAQADFMQDMIDEVDRYPNVIGYELINEPHVWTDSHYDRLGELHTWLATELRKSTDKVLIFTRETAHGLDSDGNKYQRKSYLEYKILPKDPAKNVIYAPHIYNLNDIEKQVSQWKDVQKKWAANGYDVEIAVGEWAPESPQLKSPSVTPQDIDRYVSVWSREGWMHTYWAFGGFIYGEWNALVKFNGELTDPGEHFAKAINRYYDN